MFFIIIYFCCKSFCIVFVFVFVLFDLFCFICGLCVCWKVNHSRQRRPEGRKLGIRPMSVGWRGFVDVVRRPVRWLASWRLVDCWHLLAQFFSFPNNFLQKIISQRLFHCYFSCHSCHTIGMGVCVLCWCA